MPAAMAPGRANGLYVGAWMYGCMGACGLHVGARAVPGGVHLLHIYIIVHVHVHVHVRMHVRMHVYVLWCSGHTPVYLAARRAAASSTVCICAT